jgi:hypothetical protein
MNSTVILRTGEEVPTPLVSVVMLSLKTLAEQNPIALYELVEISRDPQHKLFGNTGDVLRKFNLIEADGQPHDATRLIVLAAVEREEGDGLTATKDEETLELKVTGFRLVSPVRKEQEAKERASSKTRDLRDVAFYALTRKVADIIFEYATSRVGDSNSDKPWMEDRRKEGVNPFYNQTADGLYLELYYGMPSSLWTPWGKWGFGGSGSGSWENILPSLLERFGATLHQPLRTSKMGEFGPVYALHKVDDKPLPDSVELDNSAYASYEDSKTAWEELAKQLG